MQSTQVVTFLGMQMTRRTRWNFLCEAVNAALAGGFVGIVNPFTLPLAVRLGATNLQVGLIAAAPFIANLLGPLWSALSRGGRQLPWVVGAHIVWRGGQGLIGLLTNPSAVVAVFFLTHLAVAAGNPAYGALVQKVFPPPIRGRLMGYVRLALAAAMLVTTLVGGRLMDSLGPAWLYPIASFLGLLGIGVYALTREEPESGEEPAQLPTSPTSGPSSSRAQAGLMEGLRQAVTDGPFRTFLLASILFHGGALLAQPLYSVYQVKQLGLSNVQISYLVVAWNLAWLAAFAFWGRVIDRRGARPVVTAAAALYAGLPLAHAIGGTWSTILLGQVCQGIADAALDLGAWNLILSTRPERVRPYTSAWMVAVGVRGAIGPLVGSWMLSRFGFRPTFFAAAALVLAGLVVFLHSQRAAERKAEARPA
jgi:MFS family permease